MLKQIAEYKYSYLPLYKKLKFVQAIMRLPGKIKYASYGNSTAGLKRDLALENASYLYRLYL